MGKAAPLNVSKPCNILFVLESSPLCPLTHTRKLPAPDVSLGTYLYERVAYIHSRNYIFVEHN